MLLFHPHQYSKFWRSLIVTHQRTWRTTCSSSFWHTLTIPTVTSSHFSPGSEKSMIPKSWRSGNFARSVEMASRCHQPPYPGGQRAVFRHSLIRGGLGGGKEKNRQEGKHTLRCDARLQRSWEFIFSVFHHARLMFVQVQKIFWVGSGVFFLLESECLVATSLNMLDLWFKLDVKQLTAAPVVASGVGEFSTYFQIRKTLPPNVYLQGQFLHCPS